MNTHATPQGSRAVGISPTRLRIDPRWPSTFVVMGWEEIVGEMIAE
jgi:hypothetical protein